MREKREGRIEDRRSSLTADTNDETQGGKKKSILIVYRFGSDVYISDFGSVSPLSLT